MSEKGWPRRGVPLSPSCGNCRIPMTFVAMLPRVSEPGRIQLFQCATCNKMDSIPEA
jgi:hypothetical protein